MTAIHRCSPNCEWHGENKRCRGCLTVKPADAFVRDKRSPDGRSARCRECRAHSRRAENPEKNRARFLTWKYGMTQADFDRLMMLQSGRCALCGELPRKERSLHIDHDHTTGAIRGLLCSPCNTSIGLLKEDPRIAIRIARYLTGDNAQVNDRRGYAQRQMIEERAD